MGTVKIDCDSCGDMLVTSEHIAVIRCTEVEADSYRFECPECELAHVRPMATFHANVLIDAGFSVHQWSLPLLPEVDESKPLISEKEIAEFATALEESDNLSAL